MTKALSGIVALLVACGSAAASPARVEQPPTMHVSAGGASVTIHTPAPAEAPEAVESPAPVRRVHVASVGRDEFFADVYPSQSEAARAAGRKWAAKAAAAEGGPPRFVHVFCDCPDLFADVSRSVADALPEAKCEHAADRPQAGAPGTGEAWLNVMAIVPESASSPTRSISLAARTAGQTAPSQVETVRFMEKPWLSDYAAFVTATPGRWVVGRCDPLRPAMSPSDAARDARLSAEGEVTQLVLSRLPGRFRRHEGEVARHVRSHLLGGSLVADRFPQTFERPLYTVYREAVLIDASDQNLEPVVADVRHRFQERRESLAKNLGGGAALLLVIYTLYRLANAFTRGYFTWSLRTAAAVVATGAVVMLVALA